MLWTTVDVTQNGGRTMSDITLQNGGDSNEDTHLQHDINSSPITSFHPIVHVNVGCQNEIKIPGNFYIFWQKIHKYTNNIIIHTIHYSTYSVGKKKKK